MTLKLSSMVKVIPIVVGIIETFKLCNLPDVDLNELKEISEQLSSEGITDFK